MYTNHWPTRTSICNRTYSWNHTHSTPTHNVKAELGGRYGRDHLVGHVPELHHVDEGVVVVGEGGHDVFLEAADGGEVRLVLMENGGREGGRERGGMESGREGGRKEGREGGRDENKWGESVVNYTWLYTSRWQCKQFPNKTIEAKESSLIVYRTMYVNTVHVHVHVHIYMYMYM